MTFGGVIPILRVSDVKASLGYYGEALGFRTDWSMPDFAQVSRDRCRLFLCAGDQGHAGAWVFIGIPDARALHAQLRAAGARIRHQPTNYPWALEFQVEDLDGNVLRLGSDPEPDEPAGEWLDMHGVRWIPGADGSWSRAAG